MFGCTKNAWIVDKVNKIIFSIFFVNSNLMQYIFAEIEILSLSTSSFYIHSVNLIMCHICLNSFSPNQQIISKYYFYLVIAELCFYGWSGSFYIKKWKWKYLLYQLFIIHLFLTRVHEIQEILLFIDFTFILYQKSLKLNLTNVCSRSVYIIWFVEHH